MARAFLVLALAAACSGGEDPPDVMGGDAGPGDPIVPGECAVEVALGWGYLEFVPVSDGDTVPLYSGRQGGWHLFLAVQARGMNPADVDVEYRYTFTDGGQEFGHDTWNVQLRNDVGDGWRERLGITAAVFETYWTSSYLIRGHDARVDVTVTDNSNGCQGRDGWSVHIAEEPGI